MRDLEPLDVQEVSTAIGVADTDGPTEIWPADKPFPKMKTDEEWDDFITRYDFSEVFREKKFLTMSQHGHVVETHVSETLKDALKDAIRGVRQTRFWGEG
jgi:hypothetical protein